MISVKILLLSKLLILVLENKYMSENTYLKKKKSLISSVFPLLGIHEGINVLYYTSLHKSLWEVKIDSLQFWLCPEISLKNTAVPSLAVHIHRSKRLK